jgi:hypothetical protein
MVYSEIDIIFEIKGRDEKGSEVDTVAVLILSTIMLMPCERRIFLIRIILSAGVQGWYP